MRKSISLLLALLGLFDSLYLLYEYTSPSRPMLCFTGGCDAVRASAFSHLWGVPMPVFGVAGYLVITLLIIGESLTPAPLALEVRYALAGATGFGFLYSIFLEYLQGFVIHAFCTWCVTSGLVMTALCGLAIYNVLRPAPEDLPTKHAELQSYFIVGVAAILMGVPSFYYLATHGEVPPPPPPPVAGPSTDRLVRPDSHVTGNPNAAVTVVEFGDFECPVCGSEEPVVRQIRAKYANQIRFVFRQFPLTHIHAFSEKMAEASECAAEQGKFWEMMDKIYSRQTDLTMEGLVRDAAEVGLDQNSFNQCMSSGAEAARVKRDHDDGVALGVGGTPTIFIDGRALPGIPDFDELSKAIDQELLAAGVPLPSSSVPPASAASSAAPPAPAVKSTATPAAAPNVSASTPASAPAAGSSFGSLLAPPGGALSSFQGAPACSEAEAAMKQPTLINTSQLREILAGNPKPLFVDVRPAKEYAADKIPGAINIPVEKMGQEWSTLPKDRVIIFYESGKAGDICAAGRAAGRELLTHGYPFDHVKVYQDGLAGWEKAGLRANQ